MRVPGLLLLFSLVGSLAAGLGACEGCKPTTSTQTPNGAIEGPPTARLYLVSDLAGALEPCGCVKDQLGGMDHFGALVSQEKAKVPAFATLSAGPLFFMDADIAEEKKNQEVQKAETIARSMKAVGLAGFAPSRNGWAAGGDTLAKLASESGAPMLAANVAGAPAPAKTAIKEIGGLKIGLVGVAAPDKAEKVKKPLEGVTSSAAAEAVKAATATLTKEGAQAIVVLAAVGRGEAKRIADDNPNVLAILVGSTAASGDVNTKPPPVERIGDVLIVETANHLQTVAVVDLYVRDAPKTGLVKFADGTGVERARKREELSARIDELRTKIATWETDKSVAKADVDARKADLAKLESEREALDKAPPAATGSFYRYAMHEIREKLGADDAVKAQMLAYYKKVNDANKEAFKDKKPAPVPKGEAGYIGVELCTNCHEDAKKVWDATSHAHAYATLEKQFKEANLDCVSCHVTGYDKPGGSTVTHVSDLKDVQCEVCHGPGSLHAQKPEKVKMPTPKPTPESCIECHHPPHVHTFDAKVKMADILGPGHGKPKDK